MARWFAGLPDRYFASLEPKTIVRHVRLSRSRGERPIAMEVKHHPRKGYSELALSAADAPGLLASITGVLLAHRIDILSAQIHSRAGVEDGDRGEALDVFFVRDRYGRGIPEGDPRWKRVAEDLARVAQGEPVEVILAARREKGSLNKRVTPEVTTEIEIDNRVSGDFTVIDVYTQDRLGILHAITRALTTQGLDICLSKVATEAERVADVFYVRDRESGQKVQDEERLACIREALVAALKEVKAS
ncbi:MAG: hypothetical protein HY698_13700 [Deltaproteobacteria bacterium]|nr:hypothetical protein [Deltaproteobacteria bacterium]